MVPEFETLVTIEEADAAAIGKLHMTEEMLFFFGNSEDGLVSIEVHDLEAAIVTLGQSPTLATCRYAKKLSGKPCHLSRLAGERVEFVGSIAGLDAGERFL